jgi:hypothetical protein
MLRYGLVLAAGLWAMSSSFASSWADAMFDDRAKDFGSVPRGAVLTHSFHLTNNTGSPVHLANLQVSCGCVTAGASWTDLAPGQEAGIQVRMDTNRFPGERSVTVRVHFDRPRFAEVRLLVRADSREDVTITPPALALGRVPLHSEASSRVLISFLGNSQYRILDVTSESHYVLTDVEEVRRDVRGVVYRLSARIRSDLPAGNWYNDIWLKTNNPFTPQLRVPLTVKVESGLSVSPATVALGEVKTGAKAERKVIVRGSAPFRITAVRGLDGQWAVWDNSAESRAVHVLTFSFQPSRPGRLDQSFSVCTDLSENGIIVLNAQAQVIP